MSSSSDFQQDRHNFSGSQQKWKDFELPGSKSVLGYIDSNIKCLNIIPRREMVGGFKPRSNIFHQKHLTCHSLLLQCPDLFLILV